MELPPLPVSPASFVSHLDRVAQTSIQVQKAAEPFKDYENKLREIFAQKPGHPAVSANHLVPLFNDSFSTLKIRARNITEENKADQDHYLLPLKHEARRVDGTPAIVSSFKNFVKNFNIFSESSLSDLNWSNVIVAGSAAVTALLPVEAPHNESKRALRNYYHENLAPASDVDLFLYGLNEEQALEKIKQIEKSVKDSILAETTTIRTKNAITIASQYPTRHVQIVLRLYKSVTEILTGFDVDSSCVAYDGRQVWASPRAVAAFATQINTVDLSRRSPSYENRLSKYSHRGFEVYWPSLERSRVDPTIFERSFTRVQGLARLLVLEKLPHPTDRDNYLAKRRAERGRPELPWNARYRHSLPGNIKDAQPDDVPEWVDEDDVSNYHTFTVPYGQKYSAKKIEKLLFTKDLLLNAEWNRPKDREVDLHRHPAFFGSAEDVLHDCCGFCPKATSDDDLAALEEEGKIYISGEISFLKDDPGRQAIGSFHPLTDDDWTEMAYVGNTERLCQAIVDQDLEAVQDWFTGDAQTMKVADVDRRDHTGRTPLQLATMCSTPEIVECLIDHGARIVARLYNGMTALHIAAHRGQSAMVTVLLLKSDANQEEESRKEEARKKARRAAAGLAENDDTQMTDVTHESEEDSDNEDMLDGDSEEADEETEGSFVKLKNMKLEDQDPLSEDSKDDPDVYDIDVLTWDCPVSPLHLAIIAGQTEVIKLLINHFGADVLLPVKIMDQHSRQPSAAILNTTLALQLPLAQANKTVETLLEQGFTCSQTDMNHLSAFHDAVKHAKALILQTMTRLNQIGVKNAVNFIVLNGWEQNAKVVTPLLSALQTRNMEAIDYVLSLGAIPEINFDEYAKAFHRKYPSSRQEPAEVRKTYLRSTQQPVVQAARLQLTELVSRFVEAGIDVNTLPPEAHEKLEHPEQYWRGKDQSLLDLVQEHLKNLREYLDGEVRSKDEKEPEALEADNVYLADLQPSTYKYWAASKDLEQAKVVKKQQQDHWRRSQERAQSVEIKGEDDKRKSVKETLIAMLDLEKLLLRKGAKTFYELNPNFKKPEDTNNRAQNHHHFHFNHNRTYDHKYTTKFSFTPTDSSERVILEYSRLFEAAWTGDSETVKTLCVRGAPDTGPLKVAVYDRSGFSPFSVAIVRGHTDLAKLILEISIAQYQPDETNLRYRYTMQPPYDGDASDGCLSDAGDRDDNIMVYRELVSEDIKLEDVTTLADNVKSKVSPMTMLQWTCELWRAPQQANDQNKAKNRFMPSPRQDNHQQLDKSWISFNQTLESEGQRNRHSLIRYAIVNGDTNLLTLLLQMGTDLAKSQEKDDAEKVFGVSESDLKVAVRLGRTEMIGQILAVTGANMPLAKMVETSGVEVEERHEYYQGLSVYGRKRKDWADAGRGITRPRSEAEHAPFLTVAFEGNVESTEYFLSDAPLRRYQEFVRAHKDDRRIQGLEKAEGGTDRALMSWLGARNNLAIHMAVMSRPKRDASNTTLEFLLRNLPGAIESKSASGSTPLHIAFSLERYYCAKTLLAAGASQLTKDKEGLNILHTIVCNTGNKPSLLKSMLTLLGQSSIAHLLLERSFGSEPGGLTPLAMLLSQHSLQKENFESLEILLSYTKGKDLEMMNSAGDYPLHTAVRQNEIHVARFLIEYNPKLLFMENATGFTPLDVESTAHLSCVTCGHGCRKPRASETYRIESQPADSFLKRSSEKDNLESMDIHSLLAYFAQRYSYPRKLVSLLDANEVAKRLASQQQKPRYSHSRFGFSADEPQTGQDDEVQEWMGKAMNFRKVDKEKWIMDVVGKGEQQDETIMSDEAEVEIV